MVCAVAMHGQRVSGACSSEPKLHSTAAYGGAGAAATHCFALHAACVKLHDSLLMRIMQACSRPAGQQGSYTLVQQPDQLAAIVDSLAMERHVAQHNVEMAAYQAARAAAETMAAPVPGGEDVQMVHVDEG